MRFLRSKAFAVSATTLALLGGPAAVAQAATKTITVQDDGRRSVFRRFATGTVGMFLKENGIEVSPRDRVFPAVSTPLSNGMDISIEHAKSVILADGDGQKTVNTFAHTVAEFLQEQGVTLGPLDEVQVSLDSPIKDGMVIQIQRVIQTITKSGRAIPFQTVRRKTDQLYQGQKRVLTRGVEGWMETDVVTVYVNGHKVKQIKAQRLVREPVTQVILVGTRPVPQASTMSSMHTPVARDSAPGQFSRRLTVVATAYVAGGRTATGCPAEPGVIAVDPSVIPLGSKVYIPGFGVLTAADTGGAIQGDRIDICMSSEQQAMEWGRRTITVYVLSEPGD